MRELPKVAPLQFLLSEGGQYITSYKVSEKPLPEAMSVVFVIPRSREAAGGAFFDGVLRCLRWKRPSDLWSILPYIETGDGEPPPPHDPEPAVFTGNSDALAATLRDTPKRLDCTDLWTGVWCATKQDGGQSRGRRHVIVLSSAEEGPHRRPRSDRQHAGRPHPAPGHRIRPERAVAGVLPADPHFRSASARTRRSPRWSSRPI